MSTSTIPRRELLKRAGCGAGLLGLTVLLNDEGLLAASAAQQVDPLSPKPPHFAARAKSVIWLFINGGPSHVDTWDYKPELEKRDGQQLPDFDRFTGFFANAVGGCAANCSPGSPLWMRSGRR